MAWLTKEIADNLLGNARPKSYEACRQNTFWNDAFMRWWQEGANAKTMYQAVLGCYDDLCGWYAGQVTDDELIYNQVTAPGDVALIDATARNALRDASRNGTDLGPAVDALWYKVSPQMEMVYGVFYEDVGKVKDRLRAENLDAVIESAFPGV